MLLHDAARFLLQAHRADHLGLRADKGDAAGFAHFGEAGVLAEKAITGMDGGGVGNFGRADHGWNVEVAARTLGRADTNGLIGKAGMQRMAIRFRIDRDRRDAQVFAGANDPQRNFAAIGNQYFLKH